MFYQLNYCYYFVVNALSSDVRVKFDCQSFVQICILTQANFNFAFFGIYYFFEVLFLHFFNLLNFSKRITFSKNVFFWDWVFVIRNTGNVKFKILVRDWFVWEMSTKCPERLIKNNDRSVFFLRIFLFDLWIRSVMKANIIFSNSINVLRPSDINEWSTLIHKWNQQIVQTVEDNFKHLFSATVILSKIHLMSTCWLHKLVL